MAARAGRLEGRVALITGGSRGFGRATARAFAREGADVAVNYREREDQARQVVDEVRSAGRRAIAIQADVRRQPEARRLVETALREFGRIDVLVNSAGILQRAPVAGTDPDVWRPQVEVNVWGTLYTTAAVVPSMIERGYGRIINLSSQMAQIGWATGAVYAGTKAFIIAYTKSLALELGRHGITANAIGPGGIVTDMNRDQYTPEWQKARASQLPVRHLGHVDDVANAVLTFADNAAGYLTGQILYVAGGAVMGL